MADRNDAVNLILRDDTFLGVCQAIGQDFGFSPNWLRIMFGAGVLFSLEYTVIAYLALGVLVLAARLLFPDRRATAGATEAPAIRAESAGELEPAARLAA